MHNVLASFLQHGRACLSTFIEYHIHLDADWFSFSHCTNKSQFSLKQHVVVHGWCLFMDAIPGR